MSTRCGAIRTINANAFAAHRRMATAVL